jgi:hypothetical protein
MTSFAWGFLAGGVLFGFAGLAIGWSKGWAAGWYDADKVSAAKPPTEKRIHNW